MDPEILTALETDETIDITTTGRKSGKPQRIEIWFRRIDGRTYITGTPGTRDWYANMLAEPRFIFHLKRSVRADLPATAAPVSDPAERRRIFSHPAMAWYRGRVESIEALVKGSPLVEVLFDLEEV